MLKPKFLRFVMIVSYILNIVLTVPLSLAKMGKKQTDL